MNHHAHHDQHCEPGLTRAPLILAIRVIERETEELIRVRFIERETGQLIESK